MNRKHKSMKRKTFFISASAALVILLVCFGVFLHSQNSASTPPAPGSYYIEETGETYQYELKMYGKLPNASTPVSFYVYANDPDLSFRELSQMLISSQLPLSDRDFYISEKAIAN